jgi:hypothetical protein
MRVRFFQLVPGAVHPLESSFALFGGSAGGRPAFLLFQRYDLRQKLFYVPACVRIKAFAEPLEADTR